MALWWRVRIALFVLGASAVELSDCIKRVYENPSNCDSASSAFREGYAYKKVLSVEQAGIHIVSSGVGMSWIKLAVAGIALCAGASVAGAQGTPPAGAPQGAPQGPQAGPPQGGQRGRGMQMLFEGITLTDAQQKQLQDISGKYREQMRALFPNGRQGGPPDDATRARIDDLRSKQNAEIRAILTADQQTVFDKNVADAKKRSEQGGNRPPGGRGR